MKPFFFGSSERALLGVYHPPRDSVQSLGSVLVCPPIGHEYIRTHWALRLLANQLSRKGLGVLRFDYRGHGDSFARPHEVRSLSQWQDDLGTAIDRLKEDTDSESVMLVGLRAGASLAAEAARGRADVNSLIAWEPVLDGQSYLAGLRELHRMMIDLWFEKVTTVDDESHEEILGFCFQRHLLDELASWKVSTELLQIPQLVVERACREDAAFPVIRPWQKRIDVEDSDSWSKLSELEVAWLRPQTAQTVVQSAVEIFDRLRRSGLLGSRAEYAIAGDPS